MLAGSVLMFTLSLLMLVVFNLFVLISLARDLVISLVTVNVVVLAAALKGVCEGDGAPAATPAGAGREAWPGRRRDSGGKCPRSGGVATEASEVVVRDVAQKQGERRKEIKTTPGVLSRAPGRTAPLMGRKG